MRRIINSGQSSIKEGYRPISRRTVNVFGGRGYQPISNSGSRPLPPTNGSVIKDTKKLCV